MLGYDRKKKVCARETRGKTVAFTKTLENPLGKPVQLVAAGHNAKVPMLLIATASTLIPTAPRVKVWKVTDAEGRTVVHVRATDQTEVSHAQNAPQAARAR